jgi:hypothetical protein
MFEVNGSVESIFDWANAAGLDAWQKRSFETILSSFVLTFHNFEEEHDNDVTITARLSTLARNIKEEEHNEVTITARLSSRARNIKKELQTLMGVGSVSVIEAATWSRWKWQKHYYFSINCIRREYCHLLGQPFTIRTIVVTCLELLR